ncbi:SGNH/GDSL hydrolase family protein [Pseudogulbenkiania sp. MAI-1]|uniref:SGNH/GDSL hydrolase family protein n=1 Tax=Pseudogulbenkiania sp. MAI-1 TaxID=990370 RepID=UPI00045E64E5|nr:SGNH/GDSL hydrolase family protein [Pseudogulbenkiania sp. MAI-1]
MNKESARKWVAMGLLALALLTPGWGAAQQVTFDRIVVFGTSLSDPGNVYALTGQQNTPPYDKLDPSDPFLIPSAPYAVGGHHFSDGPTWVEQFAVTRALAGNTRPAFRASNNQSSNYAVGGARARNTGALSLSAQVSRFLADFGNAAPAGALYVVEVGSNDVRDAFVTLVSGGDASGVITAALSALGNNIELLHAKGARKFLVADVPDLGLTPATLRLDQISPGARQAMSALSLSYNMGLADLLSNLQTAFADSQFVRLNVFQTVNELTGNPSAFGLSNVTAPCVTPNLPPFTCSKPSVFLFWDGIHPTKTVHAIFSKKAAQALAE